MMNSNIETPIENQPVVCNSPSHIQQVDSNTVVEDSTTNEKNIFDGLPYKLENRLLKKLKMMCDRCTDDKIKRDALLINEGGEGEGKSNISIAEAGVIKHLTGRPIHLFFKMEPMLRFAQSTEDKIIIWDEPSLDALSTDSLTSVVKDLTRLLMTVRKKRHFFIINITKFWKFPEYIIVDRSLGMVHVYSRKQKEIGRIFYIKKKNLENLWNDYQRQKKRSYAKYKSFGGSFPEVMNRYYNSLDINCNGIEHSTLKDYEREKDKAIESIGGAKKSKKELMMTKKMNEYKYKICNLIRKKVFTMAQLEELTGIHHSRLGEWMKIDPNDDNSLEKEDFEGSSSYNIIVSRGSEEKNPKNLLPN